MEYYPVAQSQFNLAIYAPPFATTVEKVSTEVGLNFAQSERL
jgi:hypothetical protein